MRFLKPYQEYIYAGMRIMFGFMFMLNGAQKLFGAFDGRQVTEIVSQRGLAGIIEFLGGMLILLGLFTAPVAFIASGEMAVAYFQSHFPRSFWPVMNGGERAAMYCWAFLYIAAHGSGLASLDRLLLGRKDA